MGNTIGKWVQRCLVSRPDGEDVEAIELLLRALQATGHEAERAAFRKRVVALAEGLGWEPGSPANLDRVRWRGSAWREFRHGVAADFAFRAAPDADLIAALRNGRQRGPTTVVTAVVELR